MIRNNCVQAFTMFVALLGTPYVLAGADQSLAAPDWLTPFPASREQKLTTPAGSIDASHVTETSSTAVIEHYETQFRKANILFQSNFDGIGTTIRIAEGQISCVIRATEAEAGTRVKLSCVHQSENAVLTFERPLASTPVALVATQPIPARPVAIPAHQSAGSCFVDYESDGPMKAVSVTFRNDSGGSDQKVLCLPYKEHFVAPAGSMLYLSAQKTRLNLNEHMDILAPRDDLFVDGISGKVHVAIRVNEILLEEASASAPYGIATAKGSCPR
jgi:hypothetical protein